jgi:glutathione S-transferase
MYRLYYAPGAASFVVHWVLLEIGAPHELIAVDLAGGQQKTAEYLRLNPVGVVPTLIVEGAPLFESSALAMLLAARHPGSGLLPVAGTRAADLNYQWLFHLANSVQPAFRHWFHPEDAASADCGDSVKESARGHIEAAWGRLDALLGTQEFLTGSQPAIADFMAVMLARWSRNMPRPATTWPKLAAYIGRMKARPTFAELNRREGLTEWL